MTRWTLVLFVLSAPAGLAQTSLMPSRTAITIGASYAGALQPGYEAPPVRAVAAEVTVGRVVVSGTTTIVEDNLGLAAGLGYHVVRDLGSLRTATLGLTAQTEQYVTAVTPSFTYAQRVAEVGRLSIVPTLTTGVAFINYDRGRSGGVIDDVAAVASVGLGLAAGTRVRATLTPQVSMTVLDGRAFSGGLSAGVVFGP